MLPTIRIESKEDLSKAIDRALAFVKDSGLPPAQVREYRFTIAVLNTLAGAALDIAAQEAGEQSKDAVISALIRRVARQIAKIHGYSPVNRLS